MGEEMQLIKACDFIGHLANLNEIVNDSACELEKSIYDQF